MVTVTVTWTIVAVSWAGTIVSAWRRALATVSPAEPLAVVHHTAVSAVAALDANFAQSVTQIDVIDFVVLSSAESHNTVNVVGQSASLFSGTWRLSRYRDSHE